MLQPSRAYQPTTISAQRGNLTALDDLENAIHSAVVSVPQLSYSALVSTSRPHSLFWDLGRALSDECPLCGADWYYSCTDSAVKACRLGRQTDVWRE